MKKVIAIACAAALIATVGTVALADDSGAPKISAAKATGAVTVDGNFNEPGWQINTQCTCTLGAPNNTVTFGNMWDSSKIYVGIHVVDDAVINSNAEYPWNDDECEVYVDGDLAKGEYTSHTAQFVFRWDDPATYMYSNGELVDNIPTDIQHAFAKTSDGYNLEIAIPWADIGGLTVKDGQTVGFAIHNDDKDVDDATQDVTDVIGFTSFDNGDYHDSSNWAELTLSPAAAASSTASSSTSSAVSSSAPASSASSTSSTPASSASSVAASSASSTAPSSSTAISSASSAPVSSSVSEAASSGAVTSSAPTDLSGSTSTAVSVPESAAAAANTQSASVPDTGSAGILGAVITACAAAAALVITRRIKK